MAIIYRKPIRTQSATMVKEVGGTILKKPIKAQKGLPTVRSPYYYQDKYFESPDTANDELQPIYWMTEHKGDTPTNAVFANGTTEYKWLKSWWSNPKTLTKLVSNGYYKTIKDASKSINQGLERLGKARYYWTSNLKADHRYNGEGYSGMWESNNDPNVPKGDRVYLNRKWAGNPDNRLTTLHEIMHGLAEFTNISDSFPTDLLNKGNVSLDSIYKDNEIIPYEGRNIANSQFMRYYLGQSGEIYPRLMTMRAVLDVKPGQTVTSEMIKTAEEDLKAAGLPELSSAANGQISKEQIYELLANILSNTASNSPQKIDNKGVNLPGYVQSNRNEVYV